MSEGDIEIVLEENIVIDEVKHLKTHLIFTINKIINEGCTTGVYTTGSIYF